MWHLIRVNNKKDLDKAEEALKTSQLEFFPISSLVETHHSQPAIRNLLNSSCDNAYFIEGGDTPETIQSFLSLYKELFQKVRRKTGNNGHVRLSQEEFDQFILILQTPEQYKVLHTASLPPEDNLKSMEIPYGPLQGLKGEFLNTKTPSGKRFYVNVLSLFYLEIRIPIKDVRKSKESKRIEISYLLDEQTPHWYLLSSFKKEYIEHLLGDSINPWNIKGNENPIVTTLTHPETQQKIQTTRYLYRAIYLRPTKEGYEEIDLMPHSYFFKTTRYDLETFRSNGFDSHIYIMRNNDGSPIRIPEAQMRIFAHFLQERSEATEVLFQDYEKGDAVRVVMGIEANNEIEGTVEVVTKSHYILISENGFKINVRKKKK